MYTLNVLQHELVNSTKWHCLVMISLYSAANSAKQDAEKHEQWNKKILECACAQYTSHVPLLKPVRCCELRILTGEDNFFK